MRALETVAVRRGQTVWTVEALCVDTGRLYGIATDPRMARDIGEELEDLGSPPPVLSGVEGWQILWTLEPAEQSEYWERHWRGE